MRLVVLGAPGAGKGTQARNLADFYGVEHVSTGDMLREHIRNHTLVGESIKSLMDKGSLVPDEMVMGLVIGKIMKGKYVLDGFPRNLQQAQTLEMLLLKFNEPLDRVVHVNVDDETIIERISGRLTCPDCGALFHSLYYPPKSGSTCDACSAALITRQDDKTVTVKNRLKVYHEMTKPIIDFYRRSGLLVEVDGIGEMKDITDKIVDLLKS